ncbi:hypothetical protein [Brucella anthropi]|uniref:hypothetical protein n=1 Tax=Brucella anthropi TaxID=529 RepID=UPI0021576D89|nr:hypothetical protein [Brucella anthropi]MCR8493716.1 hypothetical protein [Brucella anthropi]
MSRFQVTIHLGSMTDSDGAIGYDTGLRTFFLQGFIQEDEDDRKPEIWLGAFLEEFPTLDSLLETAKKRGYSVSGLKNEYSVQMLAEASQKPFMGIGERLGIVQ